MDKEKLIELNKLKKEIDELYNFIFNGTTLSIKLIGKTMILKRPKTYLQQEYIVPSELRCDIEKLLTNHLVKMQNEFEKN